MLELRPAGLVPRFAAFFIDAAIRFVVYITLAAFLGTVGRLGVALWLIALFLVEWFYPVFFEIKFGGATPGKRVMGITVVEQSGLPVGVGASITRNLLRFVDFLPFGYGAGIVSMMFTKDFKRLGDLAAGTLVVYRSAKGAMRKLPEASALPVIRPLDAETQLALIGLAERSRYLTPERSLELMQIADALVEVAQPLDSAAALRARVLGRARWLMGERDAPEARART